ncbi:glycosyltransferase family 4 protein [Scytonema sp. NUACC26]|uniref:glycosyltransferase family 4 protein n=1 Tax=Scytonema sp. NUACC26 TaxID=3140176 RepID=UPI0038B2F208
MSYLQKAGCEINFLVLNSSPNGNVPWCIIPPTLASIAKVSARNNIKIGHCLLRFNSLSNWLIEPLRLIYDKLPEKLKNIYRSARDQQQLTPMHRYSYEDWDFLATSEEIAFANSHFIKFQPDVVINNYAWLSGIFDVISTNKSVLKVILTHDLLHRRFSELKKIGVKADISEWNYEKESILLQKAHVLLAIQEEEAEILQEMASSSKVIYTPMSVVCHSHNTEQIRGRCLFVGSSAPHNAYSLQWFLDNVWSKILELSPHSSLHICGTVCQLIQKTFPNVRLLGRVNDLNHEYSAAEVCLIPLLAGSGLKIKLVEAMSYGRACVSTSVGVQGLRDIVGTTTLVADTAEDFAMAVHTVLTNPDKRQWMEEQAYKYVREKLSPEAAYQPFVDYIHQHLQQSQNNSS